MKKVLQLKGYKDTDYVSHGYCFVYLYKKQGEEVFGKIVDGKMILSPTGKIVEQTWLDLPNHIEKLTIEEYQITPCEIIGIIKRKIGKLDTIVDLFKNQVEEKMGTFESFWSSQNKKRIITTQAYHQQCVDYVKKSIVNWKTKRSSLQPKQPKTKKLGWWQKIIYKIKKLFKLIKK